MANLKLDLSAAKQADQLLFSMIDTLIVSADRAKAFNLQKENAEFYKQEARTRTALGYLDRTIAGTQLEDSGSIMNSIELLIC